MIGPKRTTSSCSASIFPDFPDFSESSPESFFDFSSFFSGAILERKSSSASRSISATSNSSSLNVMWESPRSSARLILARSCRTSFSVTDVGRPAIVIMKWSSPSSNQFVLMGLTKAQLFGCQGPKASTRFERKSGVSKKICPSRSDQSAFTTPCPSRARSTARRGFATKIARSAGVPRASLAITSRTTRASGFKTRYVLLPSEKDFGSFKELFTQTLKSFACCAVSRGRYRRSSPSSLYSGRRRYGRKSPVTGSSSMES